MHWLFSIIALLLQQNFAIASKENPYYQDQYRDDIAASGSSHIPIHSYSHLGGGYIPHNYIGNYGGYHPGFIGGGIHHGGYFGGGLHHGGFGGGGSASQSGYNSGNKHVNDGSFQKGYGNNLQDVYQDRLGYNGGKIGLVNSQSDGGLYFDAVGGKKRVEDGQQYNGAKYINQGGANADQNNQKNIRRKGHVVKGFKKSHHSDETSDNEEYYDEAHNEGDTSSYKAAKGSFSDSGQASAKGLVDNNYYKSDQKQNKGHYDKAEFVSKNNKDEGHFGHNNYLNKGNVYGLNSGFDAQSLLGHQESEDFHKYHHTPFFIH